MPTQERNQRKEDNPESELVTSETIMGNDANPTELAGLFETEHRETDARHLAVLSDIHSNNTAMQAVLQDLEDKHYDIMVNLGDFVGYYTEPESVVTKSRDLMDFSVMGNHDFAVIEPNKLIYSTLQRMAKIAIEHNKKEISDVNKLWLRKLPMKMKLKTPYGSITMVHGDPVTIFGYIYGQTKETMEKEITEALNYVDTEFLLVGHTHIQGYLNVNGKVYLNPGAVGQPRDNDSRAAYAILDLKEKKVDLHRVEYNIEEVKSNIHKCQFPSYLAQRLELGK